VDFFVIEIIGIVAAAAFIIAVIIIKFMYYPKKEKNKLSSKSKVTMEYLTQKFDDLLALRAILVIKKDSGILMYSYIVECDDDVKLKSPDFISGVVHAIQNIGKELGFKDQFSRLVYGNYQIISNSGQYCSVVLISRTEPSSIMEDNIVLLAKSFEKKYSMKLKEHVNYVNSADYEGTLEFVRDIFDTFFIEGLNLLYNPQAMKGEEGVPKIGILLLDQAALQFKKLNSVCLKTLLIDVWGNNVNDVQKKTTKDDLIHEMYQLYKANYFAHFS